MILAFTDDLLAAFNANGAGPLPAGGAYVEHDGARIWHAAYGTGTPVILLHGGLGNSGNWGHQVPALVEAGYKVIVIDSRGHGRSTRDDRPYSYDQMAGDVLAVMGEIGLQRAAIVGWSDGACIGLAMARRVPERIAGILFFACNVDPSGAKPFEMTPSIDACITRHRLDYAALSATPADFDAFAAAVSTMQASQPNYSATDLAMIAAQVTVLHAENDEFITEAHAEYLAEALPGGELREMSGVSHFAPLQRPALFNAEILRFLRNLD